MRASSLRRVSPPLAAAALALVAGAGCLPNSTWLPDSSGFVYTGGKNKDALHLYDLGKKAPRVLVEKGAGPAWPAVSPDGRRIAVALRRDDGTDVTLEVIVFDRDGKELHRSEKMEWVMHGPSQGRRAAQVFWVPDQDKLLLENDGLTGLYDLKMKTVAKLDVTLTTYGATPIRPDGKGFLALKSGGNPVLVDWDGREQEIKPTPGDARRNRGGESPLDGMLLFPMMHSSHWDGSTAVVSWDNVRVTIDADKRTAALEHFKPALSVDKLVVQNEVRLAGGGVVRAVELEKRYRARSPWAYFFLLRFDGAAELTRHSEEAPQGDSDWGRYRIEVVKPGAMEPTVLMDEAGFFLISPSPDGKRAVVHCSKSLGAIFTESKPGQDVLFLIDGDGGTAATIDLAK
jgi:hypothetical protein